MIGARIYATAGSEAKRELLSGLGVEYVGDSRSVDFADEILTATDGYGVDVVLNSLSGEAIRRGVEILAPGGRFIELGKKDVYADAIAGIARPGEERLVLGRRSRPESSAAAPSGTAGCCSRFSAMSPTAGCRCFPSPNSPLETRSTRSG